MEQQQQKNPQNLSLFSNDLIFESRKYKYKSKKN